MSTSTTPHSHHHKPLQPQRQTPSQLFSKVKSVSQLQNLVVNDPKYVEYLQMRAKCWNAQRQKEWNSIRDDWENGAAGNAQIEKRIVQAFMTPREGETVELIYAAVPYWVRHAMVWVILQEEAGKSGQKDLREPEFLAKAYKERIEPMEYKAKEFWFSDVSKGQRPSFVICVNTPELNVSDVVTEEFLNVMIENGVLYFSTLIESRGVVKDSDVKMTADAAPAMYSTGHLNDGQISFVLFLGRHVGADMDPGSKEGDPSTARGLILARTHKYEDERKRLMRYSIDETKEKVNLPLVSAVYDFNTRAIMIFSPKVGTWLSPKLWLYDIKQSKDPALRSLAKDKNVLAMIKSFETNQREDVFNKELYWLKKVALRILCVDSRCETMGSEGAVNMIGAIPARLELMTMVIRKRFMRLLSLDFHNHCGYLGFGIDLHKMSRKLETILKHDGKLLRLVSDRIKLMLDVEERRRAGDGKLPKHAANLETVAFGDYFAEQIDRVAREHGLGSFLGTHEHTTFLKLFQFEGDMRNLVNHMIERGVVQFWPPLRVSPHHFIVCPHAAEIDKLLAERGITNFSPEGYEFLVTERIAYNYQKKLEPLVRMWEGMAQSPRKWYHFFKHGKRKIELRARIELLENGKLLAPKKITDPLDRLRRDAITGKEIDISGFIRIKMD